MKVKLDENLGSRGAEFLRKHNFDVLTVADQGLLTAPDEKVVGVCASEGRCLITLDVVPDADVSIGFGGSVGTESLQSVEGRSAVKSDSAIASVLRGNAEQFQ